MPKIVCPLNRVNQYLLEMRIQDTGKALALSVFLHGLLLSFWLGVFDESKSPIEKKRIDSSQQKSSINITYVDLKSIPIQTPTIKNLPEKPSSKNTVQITKPAQTVPAIEPKDTEKLPENTVFDPNKIPLKASKYFSADEVLEPAKPLSDWLLDNQALPSGRIHRIFVQIWILETGEFEKFELIDESITDEMAISATKNLLQTPMLHAIRNGKPVASTRKLIILVDKDE